VAISEVFAADGPAIVDAVIASNELPNVPHLEADMIKNVAVARSRKLFTP
jgi:pyruvate dehydrogenase (quinone)